MKMRILLVLVGFASLSFIMTGSWGKASEKEIQELLRMETLVRALVYHFTEGSGKAEDISTTFDYFIGDPLEKGNKGYLTRLYGSIVLDRGAGFTKDQTSQIYRDLVDALKKTVVQSTPGNVVGEVVNKVGQHRKKELSNDLITAGYTDRTWSAEKWMAQCMLAAFADALEVWFGTSKYKKVAQSTEQYSRPLVQSVKVYEQPYAKPTVPTAQVQGYQVAPLAAYR